MSSKKAIIQTPLGRRVESSKVRDGEGGFLEAWFPEWHQGIETDAANPDLAWHGLPPVEKRKREKEKKYKKRGRKERRREEELGQGSAAMDLEEGGAKQEPECSGYERLPAGEGS
ncbi:MAG: hypothetical protein GY725_25505, partial [bacterium]|nr:hypothetical protein [bacterium]